ncbi:MAG: LysR family transcriptional regulator [Alphaproteobacteria bacterium]|nr:LysR family transcriptional regulator [Alphaproteobacteria bacterium]
MFDLKQVRCFVAVAGEMNFARAAKEMNMTQSPLRRQIRLLEEDLGVHLLDRGAGHVRLTRPGRTFLSDARQILQATTAGTAITRQVASGERGTITLGFTTTAGYVLMPQMVASCRAHLPDVTLLLREMSSAQQIEEVIAGRMDFGLVWTGSAPVLSGMPMASEPLVAALPANDPRLRKASLSPSDFDGRAFIMYDSDDAAHLNRMVSEVLEGFSPHMVHHAANAHAILSMVGSGLGAAMVPLSAAGLHLSGVSFRPLNCDRCTDVATSGIWRDDNSNPALARFVDIIAKLEPSAAPSVKQRQVDPAIAIARRKMDVVGLVE